MNKVTNSLPISDGDFPALYQAADNNSLHGQRQFLMAMRIRLAALVLAAAFGGFTILAGGADIAGIAAASAFGTALIAELYLFKDKPERAWYDGRAIAESTKTLTWRFIVGGNPFGKDHVTDQEAERLLLDRLVEIADDLKGIPVVPVVQHGEQITAAMRRVRALPLAARRELYETGRIHDQRSWYANKAQWNQRHANVWAVTLAVVEAIGLTGAVLKAAGVVDIDVLSLAGALVAAGAAWAQTKQHQTLARAYAVASHELSTISARMDWAATEGQWSHFVDQAEDAISREHTLWRASHS